jgi:hypothetical protein
MEDGYPLNSATVIDRVEDGAIGNFRLGNLDPRTDTVIIKYIGRSDGGPDQDLKSRLLDHAARRRHGYFFFAYQSTVREAFEQECLDYHAYPDLANRIHPDRPSGEKWRCPKCNVL